MPNNPKIVKIKECKSTGFFEILDRQNNFIYKGNKIINNLTDVLKGMSIIKALDEQYIQCECEKCTKVNKTTKHEGFEYRKDYDGECLLCDEHDSSNVIEARVFSVGFCDVCFDKIKELIKKIED